MLFLILNSGQKEKSPSDFQMQANQFTFVKVYNLLPFTLFGVIELLFLFRLLFLSFFGIPLNLNPSLLKMSLLACRKSCFAWCVSSDDNTRDTSCLPHSLFFLHLADGSTPAAVVILVYFSGSKEKRRERRGRTGRETQKKSSLSPDDPLIPCLTH